ncbi:thymidylate synthase [bacterium]|jgi:thymidylate synthase|nr:thymidylate synthase [bacterium]
MENKFNEVANKVNNIADDTYHNLMRDILSYGKIKENRTVTRTLSLFGPQLRFKMNEGFPLITTRKIHWKSVVGELLWFLSGNTNKFELKEKYGVSIWDEWGNNETGELGPIYGKQWINWEHTILNEDNILITKSINQLQNVINKLQTNPDDRRLIVTAWNPGEIDLMSLPPCHWSFQFYSVINNKGERELSIIMNIRSWDVFLGGPFNIAEYALLLMMVAKQVNMIPYELIINAGDAHIYQDHIPYVKEQLLRESFPSPTIYLNPEIKNIFDYTTNDIKLINYVSHSNWKNISVAV